MGGKNVEHKSDARTVAVESRSAKAGLEKRGANGHRNLVQGVKIAVYFKSSK